LNIFKILANVIKLFQVLACLGHGQSESCNRDCVTFVKAQILTETSFGSNVELDSFSVLEEINWESMLPLACLPRF